MRHSNMPLCLLLFAFFVGLWPLPVLETRAEQPLHAGHGELPAGTFTPHSLYQVESTWVTESGQRLRLGELRGKIRVLAMAYTSCEYACPVIVETMKRIEASLPLELRAQVGFVVVTFDPERDTCRSRNLETFDILDIYSSLAHP